MTVCKGCKREVTRARFVESVGWFCLNCAPRAQVQPGQVFPFTAFGIADGPKGVEVQSMRHLRKLEAKYGVQSVAFNQNETNFGDAPRRRE